MRGDQLARQWRVIRAIEASPGGLTVAEIANFPSTLEALQGAGFPLYTERVEKANPAGRSSTPSSSKSLSLLP